MTLVGCCTIMYEQAHSTCVRHPDKWSCPDLIVAFNESGQLCFPIRDGGRSYLPAIYCPWCGVEVRYV